MMIDVKEFVKLKFNIERELYLHNKVDDMDYVDLIQLLNEFQEQLLNKHNVTKEAILKLLNDASTFSEYDYPNKYINEDEYEKLACRILQEMQPNSGIPPMEDGEVRIARGEDGWG